MCKFSFKSYEMLIEFWNQLAQIRSNFAKKTLSQMSDRIQNTFVDIRKHRFRWNVKFWIQNDPQGI